MSVLPSLHTICLLQAHMLLFLLIAQPVSPKRVVCCFSHYTSPANTSVSTSTGTSNFGYHMCVGERGGGCRGARKDNNCGASFMNICFIIIFCACVMSRVRLMHTHPEQRPLPLPSGNWAHDSTHVWVIVFAPSISFFFLLYFAIHFPLCWLQWFHAQLPKWIRSRCRCMCVCACVCALTPPPSLWHCDCFLFLYSLPPPGGLLRKSYNSLSYYPRRKDLIYLLPLKSTSLSALFFSFFFYKEDISVLYDFILSFLFFKNTLLCFSKVVRWGPQSDGYSITEANSSCEACRAKCPPPRDPADVGHWFQMKGWSGEGRRKEGGAELFPHLLTWSQRQANLYLPSKPAVIAAKSCFLMEYIIIKARTEFNEYK